MTFFIVKRVGFAILTVVVATAIAFVLVHVSGSTPGTVVLGSSATPAQVHAYNAKIGWYDPWVVQYVNWMGQVLRGNLGTSLIDGRDIGADISQRIPVTAALAVLGTIFSCAAGIAMGIAAAVRGGAIDRGITATSGVLLSLPAFWVGVLLVSVFAVQLRILPATGFVPFADSPQDWARSLVLPVLTIAVTSMAGIARQTRASMGEALTQEHMRSLRALGTPTRRIVYVHALRSASLPILASIGIMFIILFGGSTVIEVLFALPGIGQEMQVAVGSADMPMVQALVLVATVVVVIVNLVLELLTRVLDPKLRAS